MFLILFIILYFLNLTGSDDGYCEKKLHEYCPVEEFRISESSKLQNEFIKPSYKIPNIRDPRQKFLLYNVNPGEGFNLRRDVYMRIASLVHKFNQKYSDCQWVVVLPPWGPLYHWKSTDIGYQEKLPWSMFFDIKSLSKYIPIVEFQDFLATFDSFSDTIYHLQHYEDMGASREWKESIEETKCAVQIETYDGKTYGHFWDYGTVYTQSYTCLKVQGSSSTLMPLLKNIQFRSILLDHAEVILHDMFGDVNYWLTRRSMRFAKHLQKIGNEFRKEYLNSVDKTDRTEQNEDWAKPFSTERSAVGGPYIGVHMRRQDFLTARPFKVPTIKHAAYQIQQKMMEYNVTKVFIATDATESEFNELKQYLSGITKFDPDKLTREKLTDGGIAIVDQWICAHARYFIGTYESTFSFRIHEEREILGFQASSTFNRLCGDNEIECNQPAEWKIVYP